MLPDGYTMHSLRHRFATHAYRGTRNLRAVQVLLGHESGILIVDIATGNVGEVSEDEAMLIADSIRAKSESKT